MTLPAQVTPGGTVKKVLCTSPGLNLISLAVHATGLSSEILQISIYH